MMAQRRLAQHTAGEATGATGALAGRAGFLGPGFTRLRAGAGADSGGADARPWGRGHVRRQCQRDQTLVARGAARQSSGGGWATPGTGTRAKRGVNAPANRRTLGWSGRT